MMDNGFECTVCDPDSAQPFLDGTTCKAKCPFGTYGDKEAGKCLPCEHPC